MNLRFLKRNLVKTTLIALGILLVHELDDYFDSKGYEKPIDSTGSHVKVTSQSKLVKLLKKLNRKVVNRTSDASKYSLDIGQSRMDRLFDILYAKEKVFKEVLDELQVASFQKLVNHEEGTDKAMDEFAEEREKYLRIEGGKVRSTDQLIDDLHEMSSLHSFEKPRDYITKTKVEQNKPTIITAANSGYYSPLQATVYDIHQNFPDYHLIVYDLGLEDSQYHSTVRHCKCEVIKFNFSAYTVKSPHITNLKTYAWKPVLIQETLRKHPTVIYIDSSIRFNSNQLQSLVDTLREVGLLTQYIELKLNCYTNPKQFEWFGETAKSYADFYTIEAWVTCALDESCIAPPGSSIGGCCGCHRYDQDALTVVSSFFYGHPKDTRKLPAYSFTKGESFFFQVRRYEGRNYFQ